MSIISYKSLQIESSTTEAGGEALTNNFIAIADVIETLPNLILTVNGAIIIDDSAFEDPRGDNALDLQGIGGKNAATQAATGQSSVILKGARNAAAGSNSTVINGWANYAGGDYSTASGYNSAASEFLSTAIGYGCTASGVYSMAVGQNTTASTTGSLAIGHQTEANSAYSLATGEQSVTRQLSSHANASGGFGTHGDAQHECFTVFGTTTSNSGFPLQWFEDGLFAWNVMQITVQVAAFNVTDSEGAAYILKGAAKGSSNEGFTIIGSTVKEEWEDAGMAACAVSDFYTHPTGIRFDVTGITDKTINWTATWHVTYSCA